MTRAERDRRRLHEALRDRLVAAPATTASGRGIASIARNLGIVFKELDSMAGPDDCGDEVDLIDSVW